MTVTVVDAGPKKVSRTADVQAGAADLFAIVADPRRHGELDGSGTVLDTVKGPDRLAKDEKFSVKMKQYGVPYKITSRVTDFQDGKVVEWRHPLGHRWRWQFDARPDGSTQVTETFDYSLANPAAAAMFKATGIPKKNAGGIESTLERLQSKYAT